MKAIAAALALLSLTAGVVEAQQFYAFANVPAIDGKGRPVSDPRTGKQFVDRVCLVWQAGWDTSEGYVQLEVERVMMWYTGFGYEVDPQHASATFEGFTAPMIQDRPDGRHRIRPDEPVPNLKVAAPLTMTRPEGCTDRWVATWTSYARSSARAGDRLHPQYFAWKEFDVFDRNGQPVVDPETGKRGTDGFCIFWKPEWVGGEFQHVVQTDPYWFTAVSYDVDLDARTITFLEIYIPDVVGDPKSPDGWRRVSNNEVKKTMKVTVPLYDKAQPGWKCEESMWARLAGEQGQQMRTHYTIIPGTRGGRGDKPPLCLPGQANIGSLSTGACTLNP